MEVDQTKISLNVPNPESSELPGSSDLPQLTSPLFSNLPSKRQINGNDKGKETDLQSDKNKGFVFQISEQPYTYSISPPRKKSKKYKEIIRMETKKELDADNWARYFLITRKEGSFTNECSFRLNKAIKTTFGTIKSIKKLNDGSLSIEVATKKQANEIMLLKTMGTYEIEIKPYERMNTSQGVITCKDFLNSTLEDIQEGLSEEGVIGVRRMKRKQNGNLIDTATLVLTFNKPRPPSAINAAFYKLKVRPYIPSPMRCYKCHKFGHISARCKIPEQLCGCGKTSHDGDCTPPIVCINCKGEHNARSTDCPTLAEEKEIQKLKTLQQLSYSEAKAIVKSTSYVKDTTSFAKKATISLGNDVPNKNAILALPASPKLGGEATNGLLLPERRNLEKTGDLSNFPNTNFKNSTLEDDPVVSQVPISTCEPELPEFRFRGKEPSEEKPEWVTVTPLRRASTRLKDKEGKQRLVKLQHLGKSLPQVRTTGASKSRTQNSGTSPIKWTEVGTDIEGSDSDGGNISDRPQNRRNRPKRNTKMKGLNTN